MVSEVIKEVIFYAPVGNLVKAFKNGGAEAGCRKTISVLRRAGYKVILIEKPSKKDESVIGKLFLLYLLIKIWLKSVILFIKSENSLFHVAGFYLNQIYLEWFLIKTANLFNLKTIYEIRNGGMIESYNSSNCIYKFFFKSTVKSASKVLCQGEEYVKFLNEKFGKKSVYYPNYVLDEFISNELPDRLLSFLKIKLIYFGRVVPDKNVDFLIDVCKELDNFNCKYSLDIIGGYEELYFNYLSAKISLSNLDKKNIIFHGRLDFDSISVFLKESHFFIFPSAERREGHSNSLTEAMGCGVVPIVSNAGFNRSVVGDSQLVIGEFNSRLYAQTINHIWVSGQWKSLSDFVTNRVIERFSESTVKKSLLDTYASL